MLLCLFMETSEATETQINIKRGKCVKRFSIAFQLILDVEHSGGSGGERDRVK